MRKFNLLLAMLIATSVTFAQQARRGESCLPSLDNSKETTTTPFIIQNKPAHKASKTPFFEESFENGLDNWKLIDKDGDGNNWELSSTAEKYAPHSGEKCLISFSYDKDTKTILTPENWLISPEIDLTKATSPLVCEYWVSGQDPNFSKEQYQLMISAKGSDNPEDFEQLFEETLQEGMIDFSQRIQSLDSYIGKKIRLAWVHTSTNQFLLKLDDISVRQLEGTDISLDEIIPIETSCGIGDMPISVKLTNLGGDIISKYKISYQINDKEIVEEEVEDYIPAGTSTLFTFEKEASFFEPDSYRLRVSVTLDGDTNPDNDSKETSFICVAPKQITAEDSYTLDFNTPESTIGTFIDDTNIDDTKWFITSAYGVNNSPAIAIPTETSSETNDWFFTSCLYLKKEKTYKISFHYGASGDSQYSEKLDVGVGSAQSGGSMATILGNLDNITNGINENLLEHSFLFTPEEDEVYFFGFHCYSDANQKYLLIDNISVVEVQPNDAELEKIYPINSNTNLNQEEIKVKITNRGTEPIQEVKVSYKINEEPPVIEVVKFSNPLEPSASADYSFSAKADLSKKGEYSITASVELEGDSNNGNDTKTIIVKHLTAQTIPYENKFDTPSSLDDIHILDANNDGNTWFLVNKYGIDGSGCIRYAYSEVNDADDWFFTPFFSFNAGKTYTIDFMYKVFVDAYPENLGVAWGNSQDPEDMTVIKKYESLVNSYFKQIKLEVTPTEDGDYTFGIHCFSPKKRAHITIDNLRINQKSSTDTNTNIISPISIYPNPSNGEVSITVAENAVVNIYNIAGKLVDRFNISENQTINFTQPTGIYTIKVEGKSGVSTQKLIIK